MVGTNFAIRQGVGTRPTRFSGGTVERPAPRRLPRDAECGVIEAIVVYKVDRLSRSPTDFARIVEIFECHNVSLVSVSGSRRACRQPTPMHPPASTTRR